MTTAGNDVPDSDKSVWDREGHGEILQRSFVDRPMGVHVNPEDGLPSPVFDGDHIAAPPLTLETFVCIADEREFVVRDGWGEVKARFRPEDVKRSPYGQFYVTGKEIDTLDVEAIAWLQENCASACNYLVRGDETARVEVWPAREPCKFLIEQMTGFEGGNEAVTVTRLCSMNHDSTGGDFMSLGNEQVIACNGRKPADFVSADRLRKFRNKSIAEGAERAAAGGVYDISKLDAVDEMGGIFNPGR